MNAPIKVVEPLEHVPATVADAAPSAAMPALTFTDADLPPPAHRWSARKSIGFAVLASCALWAPLCVFVAYGGVNWLGDKIALAFSTTF